MKPATTVTKVCRILEQFQERQSLGIADLARGTGLLPSDVHRILASLRAHHYIWQDPETKKYRLGVALMRLGLTAFCGPLAIIYRRFLDPRNSDRESVKVAISHKVYTRSHCSTEWIQIF
jgi:DNA-binding IclR family transcriptional regulator